MGSVCSTNRVEKNANRILVGKPDGERKLARPTPR
jgi:hypothetical protein